MAKYADEAAAYYRRSPEAERRRRKKQYSGQELKKIEIAGRGRALQCELCGEDRETFFDHCHRCNAFRGWLCSRCNWTLGQVKEDAALLLKMIAYLETHGSCNDQ
jgi:hypothetical protein